MHRTLQAQSVSFLLVDVQERLLPAVDRKQAVAENARKLLEAARVLEVPVLVTEQYPRGIGPTVAPLAELLSGGTPVLEKTSFSCCGAPGFDAAFRAMERPRTVIFGIETHICVLATVMDLLCRGTEVVLAADACGSRTEENHSLGLQAARDCGALVIPTESVIYQMMGRAGTPEFKALLPLFK